MEVDAQPECDPIAVPEQASQELHSSQDISRQPISGKEESRAKKSKSKSKCKPAIFQLCRRFNHTFFRPLEPASSINPCSWSWSGCQCWCAKVIKWQLDYVWQWVCRNLGGHKGSTRRNEEGYQHLSSIFHWSLTQISFQKRELAAIKSPLKKAAQDLEDCQKSQYLSDYQKIMATGITQIMRTQDAIMGTISGLLEQEEMRQKLDDALQKDLQKICTGVKKREQNLSVRTNSFQAYI